MFWKVFYQRSKRKDYMKKLLMWVGGIFVLLIVIGALASGGSKNGNTDTVTNSNADTSGSTQQSPASSQQNTKEKITLSNATAKNKSGFWQVDGEAKNNDTVKHSFTLKATFYDANGKILGTAVGAVNDLEPGDTKTYSLMSTDDVTGYKEMKVQIDTLIL